MDYYIKTTKELTSICKERGIKGYSGKKKQDIIQLILSVEKQDTGKFRKNIKDQFYTNKEVAKKCIDKITILFPKNSKYLWIEPSAGDGAFLKHLPPTYRTIGLDIDPKSAEIIKQDYLSWSPPKNEDIIVFGNPPFGRQSSLAKSFIIKSCKFANIIAFILPKSFTKPSMSNAFDKKFHLIHSTLLDKNAFVLNGTQYDVPCVFQIWEKKENERALAQKIDPKGFQYVKSTEQYDIAFRRVGGLAGRSYPNDGTEYSVQSHNFLKMEHRLQPFIEKIIKQINQHIFPSNTVGPRSLSQTEANVVINDIIVRVSS
jgi:hypothetical protein